MTWKDSMSIGIPAIDLQHKELCLRIDALFAAYRQGKGQEEMDKTIAYLEAYTREHFGEEEQLQQSVGYPYCEEHKALHSGFLQRVKELRKDLNENGPSLAMEAKINTLLVDWLVNHIQRTDEGIAKYVKD